MIFSKYELTLCLSTEKKLYFSALNYRGYLISWFCYDKDIALWNYVKLLRKTEYHYNQKGSVWHRLMYAYYRRKKNILGTHLGIEIWENSFDEGLRIHHAGNIVVNGRARIGKNGQLHGSNCIGNNGLTLEAPIIGNNVEIGVGAKVIGGVTIADNIKIGAGAVVNKSFLGEGVTLAGVPARIVKSKLKQ